MAEKHERVRFWATQLAPVAGAAVLGVAGLWIQARIAAAANAREYVQLAISILRDPTSAHSPDAKELRRWAVEVVVTYSPVALTAEGQEALRTGKLIQANPPTLTIQ
jgi:hypothetical protein